RPGVARRKPARLGRPAGLRGSPPRRSGLVLRLVPQCATACRRGQESSAALPPPRLASPGRATQHVPASWRRDRRWRYDPLRPPDGDRIYGGLGSTATRSGGGSLTNGFSGNCEKFALQVSPYCRFHPGVDERARRERKVVAVVPWES